MADAFTELAQIAAMLGPFADYQAKLHGELANWCQRLLESMNPAKKVVSCDIVFQRKEVHIICDFGSGCSIDVIICEDVGVTFNHRMPSLEPTAEAPGIKFPLKQCCADCALLQMIWLNSYLELTTPFLK